MIDGAVIFTICSGVMILAMFCLPGAGGGHVAPPPPRPGRYNGRDGNGYQPVPSNPSPPPVPPKKPFDDAVMPDTEWPRS